MGNRLKYKQKDIVLIQFPFADDVTKNKKRPALIISNDSVNIINHAYLCIKITSAIKSEPYVSFEIKRGMLAGSHLTKPSELRLNEMVYVNESSIIKKISEIDDRTLKRIIKKIYSEILKP